MYRRSGGRKQQNIMEDREVKKIHPSHAVSPKIGIFAAFLGIHAKIGISAKIFGFQPPVGI